MRDPTVLEEIHDFPQRMQPNSILKDYCDGDLYRSHPLFSQDCYALQIVAYFDELELCYPLGTHIKKHKVGVVPAQVSFNTESHSFGYCCNSSSNREVWNR